MSSRLYEPDLTGEHASYAVKNMAYRWFQTDQQIVFSTGPIFLDTIQIRNAADPSTIYESPGEWEATTADIDYSAMSEMKAINVSFARTLVKSITVRRDISENGEVKVLINAQRLYPEGYRNRHTTSENLEISPAFMATLVGRISSLESAFNSGAAGISPIPISKHILPLDINKERAGNVVEGEEHSINTFSNIVLIRPSYGDFFKDSLVVRNAETDDVLELDVDYTIRACNLGLTGITTNESGVYTNILMISEFAGTVSIDYHAVGGSVSHVTMDDALRRINEVVDFLRGNNFLTTEGFINSDTVGNIVQKILNLEEKVRILAASGQPTYGDTTNGHAFAKQLTALDTEPHWYTIATLYQVEGSSDIFTADRLKLRLRMVTAKLMADLTIGVDLEANRDQLTVKLLSAVQDLGYDLFGDSDPVGGVVVPKFRVIWNDDGSSPLSGAYLQMNVALPGLTDTLAVEDMSGVQSAWLVLGSTGGTLTPADDNIEMPDESIWVAGDADSYFFEKMMPPAKPYRAWEGDVAMSTLDIDNELTTSLLPDHFVLEDIKEAQVVVVDSTNDSSYVVKVPMLNSATDLMTGRGSIVATGTGDEDVIEVRIERHVDGSLDLYVGHPSGSAYTGGNVTNHQLKYLLVDVG